MMMPLGLVALTHMQYFVCPTYNMRQTFTTTTTHAPLLGVRPSLAPRHRLRPLGYSAADVDAVGVAATALGMASSVPQVWQTVRTQDASGLSGATLMLGLASGTCWSVYGYCEGLLPTVVSSAVAVVCNLVLLQIKLHGGQIRWNDAIFFLVQKSERKKQDQ
jgi:uncharacterized protein with PQ loop repeat